MSFLTQLNISAAFVDQVLHSSDLRWHAASIWAYKKSLLGESFDHKNKANWVSGGKFCKCGALLLSAVFGEKYFMQVWMVFWTFPMSKGKRTGWISGFVCESLFLVLKWAHACIPCHQQICGRNKITITDNGTIRNVNALNAFVCELSFVLWKKIPFLLWSFRISNKK